MLISNLIKKCISGSVNSLPVPMYGPTPPPPLTFNLLNISGISTIVFLLLSTVLSISLIFFKRKEKKHWEDILLMAIYIPFFALLLLVIFLVMQHTAFSNQFLNNWFDFFYSGLILGFLILIGSTITFTIAKIKRGIKYYEIITIIALVLFFISAISFLFLRHMIEAMRW